MRHRSYAHSLFFPALLLLVGGCDAIARKFTEKAAEVMVESQTGEKVEIDSKSGTMRVQAKDGGSMVLGIATTMPADFPKSIPVYPGATMMSSMSGTADNSGGGFMLTFTTADAVDKVGAFYAAQAAKGTKKVLDMQSPAGRTISWQTADGVTAAAVVNAEAQSGKTILVLQANTTKSK